MPGSTERRSYGGGMRAFTLIELLVVIAIISVLAAILFPVLAGGREKARQTACVANLKQMGAALLLYAQDHDDTAPSAQWIGGDAFPPPWDFGPSSRDLLEPYVKSPGTFVCPSDTELAELPLRGDPRRKFGLSYQFNGNPLGHGNNIVKQVYFGSTSGKEMKEHNGALPLSWQAEVGKSWSPVEGVALANVEKPAQNWAFADAWPGVHGGEITSYFKGTRTYMLSREDVPFRRACNLVYVDGHARFTNQVAAAWDAEPY